MYQVTIKPRSKIRVAVDDGVEAGAKEGDIFDDGSVEVGNSCATPAEGLEEEEEGKEVRRLDEPNIIT